MITTSQMIKLENLSEENGISKLKLMENAGYGMYVELLKLDIKNKFFLIICGPGNNGGDGFVLAKYLKENNFAVKVLFLGEIDKLKKESGYNYFFLKDKYNDIFTRNLNEINKSDIIIDAMLGTGVKGELRGPISNMIDRINESKKYIVSVDIPTGLNPDTGEIIDKCIEADIIYTFHDAKTGLKKYLDKVKIIDIGIRL